MFMVVVRGEKEKVFGSFDIKMGIFPQWETIKMVKELAYGSIIKRWNLKV